MVNDKKNCHWLKVIYIGIASGTSCLSQAYKGWTTKREKDWEIWCTSEPTKLERKNKMQRNKTNDGSARLQSLTVLTFITSVGDILDKDWHFFA